MRWPKFIPLDQGTINLFSKRSDSFLRFCELYTCLFSVFFLPSSHQNKNRLWFYFYQWVIDQSLTWMIFVWFLLPMTLKCHLPLLPPKFLGIFQNSYLKEWNQSAVAIMLGGDDDGKMWYEKFSLLERLGRFSFKKHRFYGKVEC